MLYNEPALSAKGRKPSARPLQVVTHAFELAGRSIPAGAPILFTHRGDAGQVSAPQTLPRSR